MEDSRTRDPEEGGSEFSILGMLRTRAKTRAAIHEVAQYIKPGMTENEAARLTRNILADSGMARTRYPVVVRFGVNTAKARGDKPAPGVVLEENDIVLIDIAPRYGAWEGDGGETFVVGDNPAHLSCARDVMALFHDIRAVWIEKRLTGVDLYRHAAEIALRAGWILNPDVGGHRISTYPHAAFHTGELAGFSRCPTAMRWVLQCHILDPRGKFGAFFSDLLLPDDYYYERR